MRRGLLIPPPADEPGQASLLSRPLRIEERVVEYLVGSDQIDLRLQPDSPAIDSGQPIPSDWFDPLRDADKETPDIGAAKRSMPDGPAFAAPSATSARRCSPRPANASAAVRASMRLCLVGVFAGM